MSGRLVASEEFWVELRAGATVPAASHAVGVSHWTGYRWLGRQAQPKLKGMVNIRERPAEVGTGPCPDIGRAT